MKKLLFSLAVAVSALASCQKDMDVLNNKGDQMNEISLRAVSGMTKSAIDGTTFPVGYDMLVSAYRNLDNAHKGTDIAADFFQGIHFAKGSSDAVWHAATPKYWPLSGNLDILAIGCAGLNTAGNGLDLSSACTWGDASNVAKKVVVAVPDNSSKFDDLLFGSANAQTYASSGTPISFKHAMAAVVFTAKTNIEYDATKNVGITINSISVDSAKFSGTLTVSNPKAGGNSAGDELSATWSNYGTKIDNVAARVWDSTAVNRGINPSESALNNLNLLYKKSKADSLATFPFGEAYVILPGDQPKTRFTVTYTIHNGKDASGSDLNTQLQYQYTDLTDNWEQGKKYIYDININLDEITIAPLVTKWTDQTAVDIPIQQ